MSSIESNRGGGEVDGGEEVACGLVVAGGDRTELFDFGEEVLDQVACFVEIAIVFAGNPAIGPWRDDRGLARGGQLLDDARVGIERLVGDQHVGLHVRQEVIGTDQIVNLATCQDEGDWLRQHHNVLVLGATGLGKSFIACALGNQAARNGLSVRYQRLPRLLDDLAMARAEGKYARLLAQVSKVRLLILDDWLMVKLTAEQRRDLMEVIDDRHGRGSTIVATQIPLDWWHDQIAEPMSS